MVSLLKEHVLANFRPERRGKDRRRAKRKPAGMSPAHLERIRRLPCAVCGSRPSHAHHLQSTGERGMGLRSRDCWSVPLCEHHHTGADGVHTVGSKRELEWFRAHGVASPLVLAERLWTCTGSHEAMCRIIEAHRGVEP